MKLVFDFGGVLFNWRPPELLRRELPHRATDAASAAYWVKAIFEGYGGDWAEFDRGTLAVPELVRRIAQRTGLEAHEVQAVVDGVPHELQPIPEMVALLEQLREAGAPLYFLSNMPTPYARHLEARHELVGWFVDGVYSADVKLIKPEAAIFELTAQRIGVPPEQLLFFDDHLPNVRAARAAGWHAEQFTDAGNAALTLRRHGLLAATTS